MICPTFEGNLLIFLKGYIFCFNKVFWDNMVYKKNRVFNFCSVLCDLDKWISQYCEASPFDCFLRFQMDS